MISLWELFTSPLYQTATLGCLFVSLFAAFVGSFVYLKKRVLIAETVSHAAYPGLVVGALLAGSFGEGVLFQCAVLGGALIFALLGMKTVIWLEKKFRFSADSALSFVLTAFLGVGILMASKLQFLYPIAYQKIQIFLFGQAATITWMHIGMYSFFTLALGVFVMFSFTRIKITLFDTTFATATGLGAHRIDQAILALVSIAVVLGLRNVGVVLMAGMMVAPAVFARFFTRSLLPFCLLSLVVGGVSALCGMMLSLNLSTWIQNELGLRWTVASGPMIVIVASMLALCGILFGTKRGYFVETVRKWRFQYKRNEENVIKLFFYDDAMYSFAKLHEKLGMGKPLLRLILFFFMRRDWLIMEGGAYKITSLGAREARQIVRRHRLWESFLAEALSVDVRQVHQSANEMEHILTREIEREIEKALDGTMLDPHSRTIPEEC